MGTMKKIIFLIFGSFLVLCPVAAEKVSLGFSFKSNSVGESDINTWINSYNSLWTDWQNKNGGSLSGQFEPIGYGSGFEVDLRIHLIEGLALTLAGSHLASDKEGTVTYQNEGAGQKETHFIRNEIKAFPLKIGLSYSYPLPFLPSLNIFANAGRQIVFVIYTVKEDYEALFKSSGQEFTYWFEKESQLRSEGLGWYFSFGAEYEVARFFGLVFEAVKTWSKVDGFKGPYIYENYEGKTEEKKASLYFYESNQWDLGQYYSVLQPYVDRPEGEALRNIRPGELDFSSFSFKFGIRLKF